MKDVLITLDNEKMYVETIFRESIEGDDYLYWYSIQGEGGQEVETTTHWIDKKHLAYWEECIDKTYSPVDLETEVVMIPERVKKIIEE